MTGTEHYQMAERLIGFAQGETERDKRTSLQLRAQVHATLALAAYTAALTGPPEDVVRAAKDLHKGEPA